MVTASIRTSAMRATGETRSFKLHLASLTTDGPAGRRAYARWRELEAEAGRPLLTITGGLNIGRPESDFVGGARASARQHGLPHEELTAAEVTARFPGFRPTDDLVAVYEPNAGILDPEACVGAHLDLAARHGAELRHGEPARRWAADGAGV